MVGGGQALATDEAAFAIRAVASRRCPSSNWHGGTLGQRWAVCIDPKTFADRLSLVVACIDRARIGGALECRVGGVAVAVSAARCRNAPAIKIMPLTTEWLTGMS
jgi:hypothetical protein